MMQNILEVQQITKAYDEFTAVQELSFTVPRGEIFALLGHNGAGKSTLIKMILGLVSPNQGEVMIDGSTYQQKLLETKLKVGYLPERMNFYDNLTAWETLAFYAQLKGIGETRCQEVLAQVGLQEAMHKRVGTFSKGMQQRLGLAQAIIHKPQLLILDEPTTGLDPTGILWLKERIRDWNREGTSIFFSSHNLGDVEELAHRVAIMSHGHLVAVGSLSELQTQFQLGVTLQVQLAEAAFEEQLQPLRKAGLRCATNGPTQLTVSCQPQEKAKVFEMLLALGLRFTDFTVLEPGLDVIYQEVMSQATPA